MQIDFHFGVTYVVARLAGFDLNDAHKIAYSAQYVDDAVHEGIINFNNRSSFAFIASAHKMLDYRNFEELANKHVWIPFHFLPGNQIQYADNTKASEFEQKLICRPNSQIAQDVVENCIKNRDKRFSLHLLGVTMHTYADTWAHQGFCGITSLLNTVKCIYDKEGSEDDDMNTYIEKYFASSWWKKILLVLGLNSYFEKLKSQFVNDLNPIGHGSVLSYPDLPFKKWKYENWNGDLVERDNPTDFSEAVEHMYRAMKRFRGEDQSIESVQKDLDLIHLTLRNNAKDSGEERLIEWLKLIQSGAFSFGRENVEYHATGEQSWLFKGLGFSSDEEFVFEDLDYPHHFMKKDWKLLHDALLFHRFSVLNVVLPDHGMSAN